MRNAARRRREITHEPSPARQKEIPMLAKTLTALAIAFTLGAAAPALAALDGDNNSVPGRTLPGQPNAAIDADVYGSANRHAGAPLVRGDNWDRCVQMQRQSCVH
jgi:hypothetical protein